MAAYSAKRTVFEAESTYTLENGRLVRTLAGAAVEQIELAQVRRVQLSYQPLTNVHRWVCSVEGPAGRIWIPSASFVGVGAATERRAEFRGFVQALTQAVASAGAPNVVYLQGSAWAGNAALVALILMGVLGVLLLMGLLGGLASGRGLGGIAWVFLPILTLSWAAQMVWRIWRGNPRRPYDPRALPADFAPV